MSYNQLGSSDIITVPTEVSKTWELSYCQLLNGGALSIYRGKNIQTPFNSKTDLRSHDIYERLVYHSINQVYYNKVDKSVGTDFSILGDISFDNDYYKKPEYSGIVRDFPTNPDSVITVLKFKKGVVGDLIKPKSFSLSSPFYNITDDGSGNIYNNVGSTQILIGNIFYETGIVVITHILYQGLFHTNPIAYNDNVNFLFNQPVKEIDVLLNDFDVNYIPNSLQIVNPDEYISVVNNKIVYTGTKVGTKIYYYTFKIDIGICDGLISNQGQITINNLQNTAIFDYTIELNSVYCDFNAVIDRNTDEDEFDYQIELLKTSCAFNAYVVDTTSRCGFDIEVLDNDVYCDFQLAGYLIGDIVASPTPTPTISVTPSNTPSFTPSSSVGVTPTPTKTGTPTPTPTPTKSSIPVGTTPTPTPTRTPTPTPSRSSSNICPGAPKFFGPINSISKTELQFSYQHTGVSSLKWYMIDRNNLANILASGTVSPTFTSTLFDQSKVVYNLQSGRYKFRIEGNNCNSLPDEIDVEIPGEPAVSPSPTPTRSPAAPGASSTPTPTPTRSSLGVCKTYKILAGFGGVTYIRYIDCFGDTKYTPFLNPGTTLYICSLVTPVNVSGSHGSSYGVITVHKNDGCDTNPSITPTPTPTRTPTPTPTRTPAVSASGCGRGATQDNFHYSGYGFPATSVPNAPCIPTENLFSSAQNIRDVINAPAKCAAGSFAWYEGFNIGSKVYQNSTGCTPRVNGWLYVNATFPSTGVPFKLGGIAVRIANGVIAEKVPIN